MFASAEEEGEGEDDTIAYASLVPDILIAGYSQQRVKLSVTMKHKKQQQEEAYKSRELLFLPHSTY